MHKLYQLAATFHALAPCLDAGEGLPFTGGTDHFNASEFAQWAGDRNMGSGGVWAALFVLSVWNDRGDWAEYGLAMNARGRRSDSEAPEGRFYMHDALGVWDLPHRAAFNAWANDAWWC